jgi:hypothetical protein
MARRSILTRERLDGRIVDIEFLLIAVIQGLALTTLAVESEAIIGEAQWIYWPYMIAGFVLIINFWTLVITHSISFISWPFDIVHSVLYMLAAFIEVAAFAQITHPAQWFIFMFVFFLVSIVLYAWDLHMIRQRRAEFEDTPARTRLYAHIHDRQTLELHVLLPAALVLQAGVVVVLWQAPDLILADNRHLYVVAIQIVGGLGFLADTIRSFGVRKRLLTECIEDTPGT